MKLLVYFIFACILCSIGMIVVFLIREKKLFKYFLYAGTSVIVVIVIIIGVFLKLTFPRYQKFLLQARLSEANVNFNSIKGWQSKWYSAHNQKYRSIYPGSENNEVDGITHANINTVIQKGTRIELGDNFRYYITAQNDNGNPNNSGFVVQACITEKGAEAFNTEPFLSVWCVFPPERAPSTEDWLTGCYNMEFFNDDFDIKRDPVPNGLDFFEDLERHVCQFQ